MPDSGENYLQLPFLGGLSEKQARHYLDPNANLSAVLNGNYVKVGTVEKRLGMGRLSTTLAPGGNPTVPAISSGLRCMSWGRSGLSVAQAGQLYSYSEAQSGLVGVGSLPPCAVSRTPITTSPVPLLPMIALVPYGGSLMRVSMFVSTSGSGLPCITLSVNDADTGDVIVEPTIVYTAASTAHALYMVQVLYVPLATAAHSVAFSFVDGSAGGVTSNQGTFDPTANVATIHETQSSLIDMPDLALIDGYPGGAMAYLYVDTSGRANYIIFSSTWSTLASGLLDSGVSYTSGGQVSCCGLYPYDIYFAWASGPHLRMATMNAATFAIVQAATTVQTFGNTPTISGLAVVSPSEAIVTSWVGWGSGLGATGPVTVEGTWALVSNSAAVVKTGALPIGCLPTAAPFVVNGIPYQPSAMDWMLCSQSNATATVSEQGTHYLLQIFGVNLANGTSSPTALPVATIAPRQLDLTLSNIDLDASTPVTVSGFAMHCPHPANYNGTRFGSTIRTLGADTAGNSSPLGGTWATDYYFDATSQQTYLYQPCELGNELHLSGPVPMTCDGAGVYETSFFSYPEFTYVNLTGGANSWTNATALYGWAVVAVYVDAAGLIDRSVPVFTPVVSVPNTSKPLVLIPPIMSWRWVSNPQQIYYEIYRTQGNGGTYLLVDKVVANLNAMTTYNDVISDSLIATASILYTTGGILDNPNPPTFLCQTVFGSRLWGVDETGQTVWYSQYFNTGQCPSFNEALTFSVPDGGPITALSSVDAWLIIFKANTIYAVQGNGPASTGQGSDLTIPQKITTDVGAVDWRSVVQTPVGIMFRSPVGIYLIDQNLSVSYIGKNVVDTLASYPTVLSATLVPSATQVRFVCSNGNLNELALSSIVIVYDYLLQAWTTHQYAFQSGGLVSSVLTGSGQFAVITGDGNLWQEHLPTDSNAYFDEDIFGAQNFSPTYVTLAWVKTVGVGSYHRSRRAQFLYETLDDHGLTIQAAVDYNPAIVQSYTWASTILDDLPKPIVPLHFNGFVNKQMSLQLTIQDTAGSSMTNGQGMRFVSMGIELQTLSTKYRNIPAIGRL